MVQSSNKRISKLSNHTANILIPSVNEGNSYYSSNVCTRPKCSRPGNLSNVESDIHLQCDNRTLGKRQLILHMDLVCGQANSETEHQWKLCYLQHYYTSTDKPEIPTPRKELHKLKGIMIQV